MPNKKIEEEAEADGYAKFHAGKSIYSAPDKYRQQLSTRDAWKDGWRKAEHDTDWRGTSSDYESILKSRRRPTLRDHLLDKIITAARQAIRDSRWPGPVEDVLAGLKAKVDRAINADVALNGVLDGQSWTLEDYFGVCPECGQSDGYVNIGSGHWF